MDKPTMFERFLDKTLPNGFQKEAEEFSRQGKTVGERNFRAGFYCGMKSKEIRAALGFGDEEE